MTATLTNPAFTGPTPRETSERMVYACPSDRNPRITYRVDLTAEGGYGRCSCTDYATRRFPAIKSGGAMGTAATACKHVLKVRLHFLNALLKAMAESEEGRA